GLLNLNSFSPAGFAYIDDISGDITKTVIPAISATATDNKVIIINRASALDGTARDWVKAKITRNGSGYTVQYGPLNATSYQTVNITKDDSYNFKFVSFTTGETTVEPAKNSWDFEWTYALYKTSFGGTDIPYAFSDLIMINSKAGVQAKEIIYTKT